MESCSLWLVGFGGCERRKRVQEQQYIYPLGWEDLGIGVVWAFQAPEGDKREKSMAALGALSSARVFLKHAHSHLHGRGEYTLWRGTRQTSKRGSLRGSLHHGVV